MCVVAAVAVAGVALSAYSQYQQGQAAGKAAEYNAKQEEYNAQLAGRRSQDAVTRGEMEAGRISADTSRTLGAGAAGFAGGNVDLSSQSVQYWQTDTMGIGAEDVRTTQYNAQQEAAGFRAEARNSRMSARLTRMQGRSARTAGVLGAGSSLLAGAAQTAYTFPSTASTSGSRYNPSSWMR